MICSACKTKLEIKLMVDYASNGIWCKNCGVELGMETLRKVPICLIDMAECWVWLWQLVQDLPGGLDEYRKKKLLAMGQCLRWQFSEYLPCDLDINLEVFKDAE